METINTRQVGQRIARKLIPDYSPGGYVACPKHGALGGKTEQLRFWAKGDRVFCAKCRKHIAPLAVYPAIGITIKVD